MDTNIKKLLSIIKSVLNSEEFDLTGEKNIDWYKLYSFARFHGVTEMLSGAAEEFHTIPDEVKKQMRRDAELAIFREANQELGAGVILDAFEERGIDCMPLKGYIIKHMYPSVEMRGMCDVDILIHTDDMERIRPIMENNGFMMSVESRHEYVYKSNTITVELHKSVVPCYNRDLYEYYGDGWGFAKRKPGYNHRYEMATEDLYVYTAAHTAKHYLNGGAGIKHVADNYVMRHKAEMNRQYIETELAKLGLNRFESILSRLAEAWFGDGGYDGETKEMAYYILNSGAWGTKERADSSRVYRETENGGYTAARIKTLFRTVFPEKDTLSLRYKIVARHGWMYPLAAVYRWFDVLFNRRRNIKGNISSGFVGQKMIEEFADHCKKVGLKNTL